MQLSVISGQLAAADEPSVTGIQCQHPCAGTILMLMFAQAAVYLVMTFPQRCACLSLANAVALSQVAPSLNHMTHNILSVKQAESGPAVTRPALVG